MGRSQTAATASPVVAQNKVFALRIIQCFNSGDMSYLENELWAPNFVLYAPTLSAPGTAQDVIEFVHSLHKGFPDFHVQYEDVIGEGDRVAVRWRTTMQTHLGPYRAVPPTGRKLAMRGTHLFRFENEKLVTTWMEIDALGGVQQMGVVPAVEVSALARARFMLASLFRIAFLEARYSARRSKDGAESGPGGPSQTEDLEDDVHVGSPAGADEKDTVRRFLESWSSGDFSELERLTSDDVVVHAPAELEPRRGVAALKEFVQRLRSGFPDLELTIEDVFGEDHRLVARWETRSQTQTGPYGGIPPTGRKVRMTAIDVLRLGPDGRVEELWMNHDALGVIQQLGLVPPESLGTLGRIRFVIGSAFRLALRGLGPRRRRRLASPAH